MTVQLDSIATVWEKLASPGLDLTRASFEIGWEVAHLAYADGGQAALGDPADGGQPALGDPADGGQPALGDPAAVDKTAGGDLVEQPRDLSLQGLAQERATRIQASLWYFQDHPEGEIPSSMAAPAPDMTPVVTAIAEQGSLTAALEAFHKSMIMACARLEGTTTSSQPNSSGALIHGLKDAYEVGRLLALVVLTGSCAATTAEFKACVSVTPANGLPETAVQRAYSLLGNLRDCFPGTAAYCVARHVEDWSDWVAGRTIDNPPPKFDDSQLAQSQVALLSQGRVWRAILSGQAPAQNYVVAASFTDAANRLFVNWATSITAIARSFLRTALARFFLILAAIILLVFAGAFVFDLLTHGGLTSGAKSGLTIATVLAAAASAAGVFHVSRTQVTSTLDDIWAQLEEPMLAAEFTESIAMSTRRLPTDTVAGAAPRPSMTSRQRFRRARRRNLPSSSEAPNVAAAPAGRGSAPSR
jgi:hypothetical protein